MKLTTTSCSSFAWIYLRREHVTISSLWTTRHTFLDDFTGIGSFTHQSNWIEQSLKTENTTDITLESTMCIRAHHSCLLQLDRVVTWSNLCIKYIEITLLLSLHLELSLTKCTHLQRDLTSCHVHTYFQIHSGCNIYSEVISLQNIVGSKCLWRHLD